MTSTQLIGVRAQLRSAIRLNVSDMDRNIDNPDAMTAIWQHNCRLRGQLTRITTILRDRWDDPEYE